MKKDHESFGINTEPPTNFWEYFNTYINFDLYKSTISSKEINGYVINQVNINTRVNSKRYIIINFITPYINYLVDFVLISLEKIMFVFL